MVKLLLSILAAIPCLALAGIPEATMYFIYGLIAPTTEVGRVLILVAFWFGGAGFCAFAAFFCFILWLGLLQVIGRNF